jgi:hypothetical protein
MVVGKSDPARTAAESRGRSGAVGIRENLALVWGDNDPATMRGRSHGECCPTPLWPTLHTSKDSFMSQPTTPQGLPTQPRLKPQPQLPLPVYRTPRPKQLGWIAMIIAATGAFEVGRVGLASGADPGTPGSLNESPTSRSGSRSRSASAVPIAASLTGSSSSMSGHRN